MCSSVDVRQEGEDPQTHLEALAKGFTEVLGDLVHANAAHCAHSQRTDQGVRVLTILKTHTHRIVKTLKRSTLVILYTCRMPSWLYVYTCAR